MWMKTSGLNIKAGFIRGELINKMKLSLLIGSAAAAACKFRVWEIEN